MVGVNWQVDLEICVEKQGCSQEIFMVLFFCCVGFDIFNVFFGEDWIEM